MSRYTKHKVDIITMGCSKNLVDSERLKRRLESKGYIAAHNPEEPDGEYVIVNTCGFIGDAKEESVMMLLRLGELKAEGRIGHLAVMGCLSERYRESLPAEMPEVDMWYGKFDWNGFVDSLPDLCATVQVKGWDRALTTPQHSAYLKISEGCNRFCAFCAIPLITGRHTSRPSEEILEEVRSLVSKGVKEFNVIAQDLSYYGRDIDPEGRPLIASLVAAISDVPGVEWIRLHYAYPADFPYDLLPVMASRPNVCKYLDIALQHASDKVLSNMRRHIDGAATAVLLDRIRREVPGIHIRTTLMTGFPGEGDAEFEELMAFVERQRFERMGAFAYCEEEDTFAAKNFADDIPDDVKQSRLDRLMALQAEIAAEINAEKVGRRMRVLVDRRDDEFFYARTEFDSPEVDGEVLIPATASGVKVGEFCEVEITGAAVYDLEALPVGNS